MRSVLALGLLIALCASANAARVHHSKPPHVIVRPDPDMIPVYGSPEWERFVGSPEWERLRRKDIPSYDDPSKISHGG
jgi:hypothetical protein